MIDIELYAGMQQVHLNVFCISVGHVFIFILRVVCICSAA